MGVELVEKITQKRKEIVRSEREFLKQILNSGVGSLIMCPKYLIRESEINNNVMSCDSSVLSCLPLCAIM